MVLMEGSSHHSWHHVNCLLPHRTGVHNIQSAGPLSSAQAWARARRDWEVGEGGRQWGRWQTLSGLEGTDQAVDSQLTALLRTILNWQSAHSILYNASITLQFDTYTSIISAFATKYDPLLWWYWSLVENNLCLCSVSLLRATEAK